MTLCFAFDHSPCNGRIQLHHLLPKREIKSRYRTMAYRGVEPPMTLTKALQDSRNLVPLCAHHHMLVENRRLYVSRVPAGLDRFAESLGLEWYLERHFEDREAA